MARRSVRLVVLPLIAVFLTIPAYSQMISFRAENPTVPPGTPGCVQVGLFLRESSMGTSWSGIVATLDYSADPGVLAGAPMVRLSSFFSGSEPGLTNPATPHPEHGIMVPMTMCDAMNTANSVILTGGMPIPYMDGTSTMLMFTENVNPMTGRIDLMASAPAGTAAFGTNSMDGEQLFAILTFPVSGQAGAIRINFANVPGGNALIDTGMMTVSVSSTTNGGVSLQAGESAIPTLSEWGMIAFLSGLLLSAAFLLRRRSMAS